MERYEKEIDKMIDSFKNFLDEYCIPYSMLRGLDGHKALHFSQLRNHRHNNPLEVFDWIKNKAPFS